MSRRPTFPLYDRLAEGRLADELIEAREEGLSFFEIAIRLREQHGFQVSTDLVRRWVRQIQDTTERPTASAPPT